ncbi:hypothetical protein ACP70R_007308 [Stipagrostis hirtigluma subsp. patula]
MNSEGNPRPNCRSRSAWRRRQRAKTDDHGSGVSLAATMGPTPVLELDKLPEISCAIYILVPLRDAARAACVSHRFLRSWRCFPNLTFSKETLGLNVSEGTSYERAKKLVDRIDHIIQNHSGIGVKTLKLHVCPCHNVITAGHLNIWLQAAVKSGIIDIAVGFPLDHRPKFNLSCSLLSCAINPLHLKSVCLTFHLSILKAFMCKRLHMIQIYAPRLNALFLSGAPVEIFINDPSQLKYMIMHGVFGPGMIQHARTKLLSIAPNLRSLILSSSKEAFNAATLPGKSLHLRHLNIQFCGIAFESYDYFSLVSFLEACPALETFLLACGYSNERQDATLKDSNADSSHIRRIPEFCHANLKKVSIS